MAPVLDFDFWTSQQISWGCQWPQKTCRGHYLASESKKQPKMFQLSDLVEIFIPEHRYIYEQPKNISSLSKASLDPYCPLHGLRHQRNHLSSSRRPYLKAQARFDALKFFFSFDKFIQICLRKLLSHGLWGYIEAS